MNRPKPLSRPTLPQDRDISRFIDFHIWQDTREVASDVDEALFEPGENPDLVPTEVLLVPTQTLAKLQAQFRHELRHRRQQYLLPISASDAAPAAWKLNQAKTTPVNGIQLVEDGEYDEEASDNVMTSRKVEDEAPVLRLVPSAVPIEVQVPPPQPVPRLKSLAGMLMGWAQHLRYRLARLQASRRFLGRVAQCASVPRDI